LDLCLALALWTIYLFGSFILTGYVEEFDWRQFDRRTKDCRKYRTKE